MSNSKLFVGNLPHAHTSNDLETMFAAFGTVKSAQVIQDRMTGQSRGFGFVEMETQDQAEAAKAALNGSVVGGRTLTVNEARERTPGGFGDRPRGPRGGGGGGYGGGGGGYGGGGGGGYGDRGGGGGYGDRGGGGGYGDRPRGGGGGYGGGGRGGRGGGGGGYGGGGGGYGGGGGGYGGR